MMVENDPNSDLIGKTVTVEGIEYTVTGTSGWSSQYVKLESRYPIMVTTAQAALLRARP